MDLSSIITNPKNSPSVEVDFQDGVSFNLKYLPRIELERITKGCVTEKYNVKDKRRKSELDNEKLMAQVFERCVCGWKGLTPRVCAKFFAVDLSNLSEEQKDAEVPFSLDNFQLLVKNTYDLDEFIQRNITDAAIFHPDAENDAKNSSTSPSGS